MRFGVFASILFHLALVGAGFIAPSFIDLPDVAPEQYIPLDLIREAELDLKTSVPAAAPEPEEEPEPEPDIPEPVVEEPQPIEEAPQPVAEAEPEPAPVVEQPEPEPEPITEPEPEPAPKPEPKKAPSVKPKPKNDELDLDALSQLIDKERQNENKPKPSAPSQTTETAERARAAIGAGDRLTASDEAKMRAAIARCWNASTIIGAPEPEKLLVVIDFELNRDGTLASQPRVVNDLQINLSGNQFWRVARREAASAVVKCAPYDFLPQERYETWKEFRFNFDPSLMVGR
ncbi:hypothetical protein [Hyphococcus sp. DH-69]|uniref:hypothetical protein n=1 Tax=Hyphococcus formosus TaxID=3143534 RepID=UPI00398AAA17